MSNDIGVKQKAMSGGAFAPPLMLSVVLRRPLIPYIKVRRRLRVGPQPSA